MNTTNTTISNVPNVEGKSFSFLFLVVDIKTGARSVRQGFWQSAKAFYNDMVILNKADPDLICLTLQGVFGDQAYSGVN